VSVTTDGPPTMFEKSNGVVVLLQKQGNSCYRNVCKMSVVSFALAVVFIIRLFSTSAFRVPKLDSRNVKILNRAYGQ